MREGRLVDRVLALAVICATALDVSGCDSLVDLSCGGNSLTSLDISGCPGLTHLECSENRIADTSALEIWLAEEGYSGAVSPQNLA